MYRQVDGISIGSPLGPILANIFVGYYEKLPFDRFPKPYIHLRYLDDTFAYFSWRNEARGVMDIVVGNGRSDTSSNPGRDWLHFT